MRLALFLALGLTSFHPRGHADDPQPAAAMVAASSPEARARFDALIAAYRALPAYSDAGTVTVTTQIGAKTSVRTTPARVAFARPDKLDVTTDLVRLVSDGTTVHEANIPLKTVRTTPCPHPFREAMVRGGALGSAEFGGMAGLPLAHVLNLVIGVEPERLLNDFAPKLVNEPDQTIDGVAYQVLRLDEADNHDWRFLIDPKTGLIAHVDLAIEGDATHSSIAGPTVHVAAIRWSAGTITTTPLTPDAFRFATPEGFATVAPLEAGQSKEDVIKGLLQRAGIGGKK